MREKRRSSIVVCVGSFLLALSLVISACSSGGGSAANAGKSGGGKTPTIKVGTLPIFSHTPLYVADAKGFWKDENLNVKLVTFNSGSETQQALLGDAVMIGTGGYTEPIAVTTQGEQTVIFGFMQAALPYRFMARPGITDAHQLVGKTIAVSKAGALSDQISHIVLKEAGVDPSKASYQQAGNSPSRLAALESGAVDAALLDSPSYQQAQQAGMNTLINVAKELKGFPYEVMYAKKSTVKANHEVFLRFMRGYIKAAKYATDPANEDEVIDIVAKAIGQKPKDVKTGYETTIKDFPPTGKPTREGIEKALAGTKEFGNMKGINKITVDDVYYPDLWREATGS